LLFFLNIDGDAVPISDHQEEMTEPTSLFLAAALTAGFVEGASVLGFHRRRALALLSSTVDNSNSEKKVALVAHTILYGVTSVPLGLVGASPGLAFLPSSVTTRSSLIDDDSVVSLDGNGACESGQRSGEENDHSLYPSPTLPATDIHGNRNLGWVLRQENSKKISPQNKWTRPSFSGLESPSMQTIKSGVISSASTMQPTNTTRFIATLDGTPLPTALAESMRRARCLFIGAGLVSYAITQHYIMDNRQQQQSNPASEARIGGYAVEFGYGQWINTNSVNFWNERMQKGKGFDNHGDLFNKPQNDKTSRRSGFLLSQLVPNNTVTDALGGLFDDMRKAMQVAQLKDEKEWDKASDTKKSIIIERTVETFTDYEIQPATTPPVELKSVDPTQSKSKPSQQGKIPSNVSWSIVITTVDVLGTSIRHLLESTYRLASSAASLGRLSSRGTAARDNSQTSS
jgi:hypothetical protein